MKKLLSLLLIAISGFAHSQAQKTDPYYVQPTDTVSPYHPSTIVRFIQQDKKGNIWLASWTGIVKYDGKVFTNYMLKESLIPFHTFCIREMKNGDLWFGTVRGGAYRYDGKTWTLYTTENGLADDLISDFMEDKNGKVWIATDGGISIYDPTVLISPGSRAGLTTPTGVSITSKKGFTNYNSLDGLCYDRTWGLMTDKTGKIWIYTRGGISTCDPSIGNSKVDKELVAQNKVKKPFEQFYIKPGVPFTNARCVIQDKKGIIWIGGADGLYSYNPEKNDSLKKHMDNFIGYIMEDKAGNIWISYGIKGGMALAKYPVEEHTANSKKITEILKATGSEGKGSQVFESTEDKDGNIWFGTMIGPVKYNPSTKEFTEFLKK